MFKNIMLGFSGLIVLFVAIVVVYFSLALPNVSDAPDIHVELTEERVERGRYLANHVAACMTCHSGKNYDLFSQPVDSALFGAGNKKPFRAGEAGTFYPANLTPSNLDVWTDGEIYRAITSGVGRDGRALFPIMPYQHYAKMDREDIYAIIAYLRTLEPIEQEIPSSEIHFPMNLIVKTIPADPAHQPVPDKGERVAYGKYLVNAASCSSCHTPKDEQGQPLPGMDFAGGFEFIMPTGGIARAANITPDFETGIGAWDEETFLARFHLYEHGAAGVHPVVANNSNTEMPWTAYSGMTQEDLKAIYAYLRTLTPVNNRVQKFSAVE